MKLGIRICLYVILAVVAAIFFGRFQRAYQEGVDRGRGQEPEPTAAVADSGAADSGKAATNTNAPTLPTETNVIAAPTVVGAESGENRGSTNAATSGEVLRPTSSLKADAFLHLGVFVLTLLALGGLVAWEVSRHYGNRAGRSIMAEDWVERRDPEYEKAEEEWAKGNHIEAISLMREYLKKNPDEQHVALRIAEIYEKDLNNPVAAVLEIEEVLTHKIGREKWGWTAIRLSNLYSGRLNQPDKALAILQRIVNEYAETGAAKKARQRLGIPEPEEAAPEDAESPEPEAPEATADSTPPPPTPPEEPSSNLPKGFRPKK